MFPSGFAMTSTEKWQAVFFLVLLSNFIDLDRTSSVLRGQELANTHLGKKEEGGTC